MADNNEKTIKEVFEELDVLVERLEDRETSLEDSFRLYQEGMELLKYCSEKLDTVEKKMLQINEDASAASAYGRNVSSVWRKGKSDRAFYGGHGNDTYPFPDPR